MGQFLCIIFDFSNLSSLVLDCVLATLDKPVLNMAIYYKTFAIAREFFSKKCTMKLLAKILHLEGVSFFP